MSIKKPYKSGGDFVRDGNGKVLQFTKNQVFSRLKAVSKRLGISEDINYYYVSDNGNYWTGSAGYKRKSF